jgi:hypothetical protein
MPHLHAGLARLASFGQRSGSEAMLLLNKVGIQQAEEWLN